MKTINRKIRLFTGIFILISSMFSCVTEYRTVTTVRPDGSCLREIYAKGDSAFLSGDKSSSPYLFRLDSGWQITVLNTKNTNTSDNKYNVKISRSFRSPEEMNAGLQCDEEYRPLIAPVETLHKRFRWFYTYYTFKTVYADISDKTPIPVNDYLSVSEQKFWFQGDFSAYSGMNGRELKDEADDIEQRFWKWYARNVYENTFEAMIDFEKLSGGKYLSKLQEVKDTLFIQFFNRFSLIEDSTLETGNLYQSLDEHFKTGYFSDLYCDNHSAIDSLANEKGKQLKTLVGKLFGNNIDYELLLPGKLVFTNAPFQHQDTLAWKVDTFRFLAGDYELIAESRIIHPWAFAVTFLLLALSGYCLRKTKKNILNAKPNLKNILN